ncbi:MAG: radical SAM protein [Spirochaetaceae bacterium]|nr:radical SAM protein [Spirochaetaceae bacterium]
MKAILIQPPFTQLNAPYPAVHYLEAFLRRRGDSAVSFDHSIELYRGIFSSKGLAKVFADAHAAMDDRAAMSAKGGGKNKDRSRAAGMDEETQRQIERYFSYERLYIEWIDGLVDFLAGSDPGMAHRLASAVELPQGARTEAFLAERGGRIDPDEARSLATQILDDLGDFITYTLDPAFGTVRYAERIASSRADFGEVRSALDSSWLMMEFYEPMLKEFWAARVAEAAVEPIDFILVTIPFPGCLIGALACARTARKAFGETGAADAQSTTAQSTTARGTQLTPSVPGAPQMPPIPRIVFGGGYVSTELRGLRDTGIFDFCDYLSFDAGYGSITSIIDQGASGLYKTMVRRADSALLVEGFPEGDSACEESGEKRIILQCPDYDHYKRFEREATVGVFPDYQSADFGAYLRVVDSENSMHRLWSDTPWLKYSLAHGCYWHRCTFCDTQLEYVRDFATSNTGALLAAADTASARSGLTGIHFVDEAMPMAALLDFARANRARTYRERTTRAQSQASTGIHTQGKPFSFWGNVRFDSSWTQGRCEFLAASGLVAVSGGIEIATERGLEMTGKGFGLASLVRTLVAMRRAGLLVHTYLIYGFPGQGTADIVDSAEFCRQLFAAGLVDSAFWHRFVLTRHSCMYREWKDGKRPGLVPLDKPWSFANNDLSFQGESTFDRFDAPLAASLDAWMKGIDLDKPVSAWFGRAAPRTSLSPGFVESLIATAGESLDDIHPATNSEAHWIAGLPAVKPAGRGRSTLTWVYRGELQSAELPEAAANAASRILSSPELDARGKPYAELEAELALPPDVMTTLLSAGLVIV